MARQQNAADKEVQAILDVLGALAGLDGESIQRVFEYVFNRLSIDQRVIAKKALPVTATASAVDIVPRARKLSIRDLKDEKQPESSNQMAALVAYYLSEVSEDERKDTVGKADLEKYFKQAGFKLPKAIPQTLINATAAGYFDSVGAGQYRLNAVGYNLVVHGLPRSHIVAKTKSVKRPQAKTRKKSRGK